MYSNKKNILQLIALLKAYNITRVVLSPGSRNAPIIHSLAQDPDFQCYTIVDERSAGFFALGIAQKLNCPVAICCTSGTALLNYSSAVAEACYQKIPLVVISADRPQAWINQLDGQTLPQPGIFNTLVKKSVQLPEGSTLEDAWYCNRLINEALIETTRCGKGPVHINIPLSEPLFTFDVDTLPEVRKITMYPAENHATGWEPEYTSLRARYSKCMIVTGQMHPNEKEAAYLTEAAHQGGCVVLAEHIANCPSKQIIGNFDALLYALPKEEWPAYAPEILISCKGHIVSKRIKEFLRTYPPKVHYYLTNDGTYPDLFQSLTHVINMSELAFLTSVSTIKDDASTAYVSRWQTKAHEINTRSTAYSNTLPYSDLQVIKTLLHTLPTGVALQLGNSSTVRNAQLFPIKNTPIPIYCNRGTSGIDGCLSTAVGFAAVNETPTFLVVGDLSFFYDMNGAWNRHVSPNLRILLVNNGGGEIFHLLPGLNKSEALNQYVSCRHQTNAKAWAEAMGFHYLVATNTDEFTQHLPTFTQEQAGNPILLETITSMEVNAQVFKAYYHHLKQ